MRPYGVAHKRFAAKEDRLLHLESTQEGVVNNVPEFTEELAGLETHKEGVAGNVVLGCVENGGGSKQDADNEDT